MRSQFFRLPARAQGQDHVAIRHHAEIAMQRVERIEHDGRRTSAGERRGNLAADMPGFADAHNDHLPARIDCFFDQLHCAREASPRRSRKPLELEEFPRRARV